MTKLGFCEPETDNRNIDGQLNFNLFCIDNSN